MESYKELYHIFLAIEKTSTNGSTKKDIINYIEQFYLYNNDKLSITDICFLIMKIDLEKYVEQKFLLCITNNNKNFYSINYESVAYIQYKEYYEKYKLKFVSIINNILEVIDLSLGNLSLSDLPVENMIQNNIEKYYTCKSFTNNKMYYLDKNLTKCTCKSYEFNNTCKHLEYYQKNGFPKKIS